MEAVWRVGGCNTGGTHRDGLFDWMEVADGGSVVEVGHDVFLHDELEAVVFSDLLVRATLEDLLRLRRQEDRHGTLRQL